MKLGELKSKIRAIRGSNPALRIELIPGVTKDILVMKTALLEHLDQMFPAGKGTETGLTLTGCIIHPEVADEPYRQIGGDVVEEPVQPSTDLLNLDAPSAPAPSTTTLLDF